MGESRVRSAKEELPAEQRAGLLKERIYITFTALAVVLALRAHHESARDAALTLLIAVTGTVLAVCVADVLAHISVHETLPLGPELRHMVRASFGALGALVLPFVFIGLALLDVWGIEPALRASSLALVAALGAIGWLAVRRARLPPWKRVVVLCAEAVLGLLVIVLELLAHR